MQTGGLGMIEQQLSEWVRRQVCLVDKDLGKCKKLVLRHLNMAKKPQGEVRSLSIPNDPALEGTEIVDRLLVDIANAAQRDANDMASGVQTYALYAYFSLDSSHCPRKIFRVAGEDDYEQNAESSEPPTEKGLTAQLMRHNEVNSKNGMVAMGFIISTLQKEVGQQREMNKHLMAQQADLLLLTQETLNEGHKRRIEEKEAEMKASMMEGVFEHLKIVFPTLVNRLVGKDILPQKLDREMYLLMSFMENLTPEQQQMFQSTMTPGQAATFGELLELYEGQKKKLNGQGGGGKDMALSLFEKRGNLVDSGFAVQTGDKRMKALEERAAAVKSGTEKIRNIFASEPSVPGAGTK